MTDVLNQANRDRSSVRKRIFRALPPCPASIAIKIANFAEAELSRLACHSSRQRRQRALFDPSEVKRMQQLGDVGKVVERAQTRYDNLVAGLKKTFRLNRHTRNRFHTSGNENNQYVDRRLRRLVLVSMEFQYYEG